LEPLKFEPGTDRIIVACCSFQFFNPASQSEKGNAVGWHHLYPAVKGEAFSQRALSSVYPIIGEAASRCMLLDAKRIFEVEKEIRDVLLYGIWRNGQLQMNTWILLWCP